MVAVEFSKFNKSSESRRFFEYFGRYVEWTKKYRVKHAITTVAVSCVRMCKSIIAFRMFVGSGRILCYNTIM